MAAEVAAATSNNSFSKIRRFDWPALPSTPAAGPHSQQRDFFSLISRVSAGPVDCAHPRATQPGRAGPREMARQEKECVLGNFNRTHNVLPKIKPGIGRPCQLQAPPRIAAGSCRSPGNDKSGENMGPNRQIQTHPGLSSLNQKRGRLSAPGSVPRPKSMRGNRGGTQEGTAFQAASSTSSSE